MVEVHGRGGIKQNKPNKIAQFQFSIQAWCLNFVLYGKKYVKFIMQEKKLK